jgi:hypothetical protein
MDTILIGCDHDGRPLLGGNAVDRAADAHRLEAVEEAQPERVHEWCTARDHAGKYRVCLRTTAYRKGWSVTGQFRRYGRA